MIQLTFVELGILIENDTNNHKELLPIEKLAEAVYSEEPDSLDRLVDSWVHDYRNAACWKDRKQDVHTTPDDLGHVYLRMFTPAKQGEDDYNLVLGALLKCPITVFDTEVFNVKES